MPNTNIIPQENPDSIDVSTGYGLLYVLVHGEKNTGATLHVLQKALDTTCFEGEATETYEVVVDRIHDKVYNQPTSPILDKLTEGKYYKFFVKKGFKYETHLTHQGAGISKACHTFDDETEIKFQQFFLL